VRNQQPSGVPGQDGIGVVPVVIGVVFPLFLENPLVGAAASAGFLKNPVLIVNNQPLIVND
jgi:hypothetical protein